MALSEGAASACMELTLTFRRATTVVLSVLMLAGVLATSPRQASAQEATPDELRELAIAEAVTAYETYGTANGTYHIAGAGYQGDGQGPLSLVDGVDYVQSMSAVLVEDGYLSAGAVPTDPTFDIDPGNDFLVFLCEDRVGVFSLSDGITPAAEDQQWWDDNTCSRDPFDVHNRPYFQLSQALTPVNDPLRELAVAEIVDAFEAYGSATGTYRIAGAGFQETGVGRFSSEGDSDYPLAIDTALVNAAFLDAGSIPQEPTLDEGPAQDFLVYLCENRVAVFSLSDGIQADPVDQQWWDDNSCTQEANDLGKPYFQLSAPVDSDPHRITAVDDVVTALEAFATDNYSYSVPDSGDQNLGYGWFTLSDFDAYLVSIADALVAGGYLAAEDIPEEPTLFDDHTDGLIIHHCLDRAAVFSLADNIAPPTEDAAWWTDNGCVTDPIENGHTYFRVTAPAPAAPLTDDEVRSAAVDEIVLALEAYAADYSRFAIAGAGNVNTGAGWFSASGVGDYTTAISDKLAELGYLDPDAIPSDPIPGFNNGFIIALCGERAVVYARPSSEDLTPSAEDAAWLDGKACVADINVEWTYFKLTGPSGLDAVRVAAVSEAIAALDAFAAVNYTHVVPDVGQDGNGNGWFSLDGFSNYQVAISDRLISQGFLDANSVYEDPLAAVNYRKGFNLQFCADRAAITSFSNGIAPSAEDAAWWADNSCSTGAMDAGWTYFQLTAPAPVGADDLRVEGVSNLVGALEAYALDNYTPSVFNAGYLYEGRGYASLDGLLNYRNAITDVLISGGYLDGSLVYEEPTLAGDYRRGFVIQICGDRAAVFSYTDGIETSVEDEAWWSDNNCPRSSADRSYFQVTAPAPNPDTLREQAVTNLRTALEAFAVDNYAPSVFNAGYLYEGRGYTSLDDNGNYRNAITDVLIAEGYLDANSAYEDPTFSGRYQRGFVVQLCGQRAAVFAYSNGIETSAEDEQWWSDNNCPRSSADRTYFQVTAVAPNPDPLRVEAVTNLVTALEAHGTANYNPAVLGAGYLYEGRGYTSLDDNGNYRNAITDVLIQRGYLDADISYEEPTLRGRYQRGFVVQLCGDRAAVFSYSNGIETSVEDEQWWSDNNCPRSSADRTYFQVTEPAPAADPIREAHVAEAVAALEAYAVDNYTYRLTGAGFENLGYGYFNFDSDNYYSLALSTFLADRGYLDSGDIPADPATAGIKERGFNVRLCEDRAAVFSLSDGGLETAAEDLTWWTDNGCVGATDAHTYFALTAPAPLETFDDQREDAVDQAIAALQAYGFDNLTYEVAGAGGNGRGQGWYQRYNGTTYPASIVSVLVAEGYLDGDNILVDPVDTVIDSHSSYDLMVYRCEDRVGVFAKSDGVAPSAEDAAWWADNNCLTAPIERHDHTYFQLADPLPLDEARIIAVTQVVDALESYGTENLTYTIAGGGARGKGQGWYQHENNSSYQTSIMNVLIDEGHLDPDTVLVDPLDIEVGSHSAYDFMIYRCADRVGVFSQTKALTPSTNDETWWTDNGCTRAPIDKHNHTYFQLADALALDEARLPAVSQVVTALESYGNQNGTYRVDGGGGRGNGQGWYQHDNGGTYPASIQSVLIDGGHLDADNLLVDPLDIEIDSHSEFDFMIYRCADRVGVFSKTKALSPSIDDQTWWADNGCTAAPIDRYDHTYFQLTAPLEALDEPITVRYTPSPIPGYKIATIIVRPQGDPLGLVIGAATIVNSGAAAQGGH